MAEVLFFWVSFVNMDKITHCNLRGEIVEWQSQTLSLVVAAM